LRIVIEMVSRSQAGGTTIWQRSPVGEGCRENGGGFINGVVVPHGKRAGERRALAKRHRRGVHFPLAVDFGVQLAGAVDGDLGEPLAGEVVTEQQIAQVRQRDVDLPGVRLLMMFFCHGLPHAQSVDV
jgi:hypothetical protein